MSSCGELWGLWGVAAESKTHGRERSQLRVDERVEDGCFVPFCLSYVNQI